MVNVMMDRPQTPAEKSDYEMLGKKSPYTRFLAKLALVEQTFAKEHAPFDGACAKQDFRDRMDTIEREGERSVGFVREREANSINLDLNIYGDIDRFELVSEDEDLQDKLVDGMRTQVKIGWTMKYRCKKRGHGVSVFVPTMVYEERFKKKSKSGKED